MTVGEARLRSLDEKARQVLGEEDGATFMEMVTEPRWAEVADKQDIAAVREDLAALESQINDRFEQIDHKFEQIDHKFEQIDHKFEILGHQWGARLERELRQFNMRLTAMMATFVMGGMVLAAGIARISV